MRSNYDSVGKTEEELVNKLQVAAEQYISIKSKDYSLRSSNIIRDFELRKDEIINKQNKIKKKDFLIGGIAVFLLAITEACLALWPEHLLQYVSKLPPVIICAIILALLYLHSALKSKVSKKGLAELQELEKAEINKLSEERSNTIDDIRKECKKNIASLFRRIASLRQMIPEKPYDEEILSILEEDSREIREYAMERMALTIIKESVDDFVPSDEFPPFCEPALLQHEIPEILNTISRDHLEAMQRMNNGEDIYVVNYYKYILPSQHQICVYSTFYDHIMENMYGEFTDSFCIQDFVSFSTRTQAQSITLRGEKILLANAMLISISLTSGDKISFNIRNEDFRRNIAEMDLKQEMNRLMFRKQELNKELYKTLAEDETSPLVDEIEREIDAIGKQQVELMKKDIPLNINSSLENIVRFLRKQLKDHKS